MAVINDLICVEDGNTLGFGNYELTSKTKKDGFEFGGDVYKIKTFNEITKLEKNGMFVYESTPGTVVHGFDASADKVAFIVEGMSDAQVTLELEAEKEYKVYIDGCYDGKVKTNLGGKLNLAVALEDGKTSEVKVEKAV